MTPKAIDRLLNPARNLYRLENSKRRRPRAHHARAPAANYTYRQKKSATPPTSQDQRHRMVPGSRPLLTLADTREPDYITPCFSTTIPAPKKSTDRAMHESLVRKERTSRSRRAPRDRSGIFFPNAKFHPLYESGSLLHLIHKWTMRTCFNARKKSTSLPWTNLPSSGEVHPVGSPRYIGPPCHIRAGNHHPHLHRGSHFCGIKVWLDFPNSSVASDFFVSVADLPAELEAFAGTTKSQALFPYALQFAPASSAHFHPS